MTLEEKKQRLLVYLLDQLNEHGDENFFPEALRDDRALGLNEGQIRLILRRLLNDSSVETDDTVWNEEDRIKTPHRLTWKGIQEAEQFSERRSRVPASDRYVSLTDNQKGEVRESVTDLLKEIAGDNEASEEDRLIAISEIAAFEGTIAQPRVSTDLIDRFVNAVLSWVTRTFSRAAIAEVAQRLVQALLKLIS